MKLKHKNLKRHRNKLAKLSPEQWNFAMYQNECKTVGCSIGWACQWFKDLTIGPGGIFYNGLTELNHGSEVAKYLFIRKNVKALEAENIAVALTYPMWQYHIGFEQLKDTCTLDEYLNFLDKLIEMDKQGLL